MKTLFIVLLVATVCIGKARPLTCYTCPPTMSIDMFQHLTECDRSDNHCITEMIMGYDDRIYGFTKRCAPTCSKESEYRGKRRIPVKCCETDACNDD